MATAAGAKGNGLDVQAPQGRWWEAGSCIVYSGRGVREQQCRTSHTLLCRSRWEALAQRHKGRVVSVGGKASAGAMLAARGASCPVQWAADHWSGLTRANPSSVRGGRGATGSASRRATRNTRGSRYTSRSPNYANVVRRCTVVMKDYDFGPSPDELERALNKVPPSLLPQLMKIVEMSAAVNEQNNTNNSLLAKINTRSAGPSRSESLYEGAQALREWQNSLARGLVPEAGKVAIPQEPFLTSFQVLYW